MWPKITLLALGTFAIGSDGFIVAGVLRQISGDLGISVTAAGQQVSACAVTCAIGISVVASFIAQVPRRRLLLAALAVLILGNGLTAIAQSYATLMLERIVATIASVAYTPCAPAAAATLAGPTHRRKALSLVMGGITVSTIIGVQMGTWLARNGGFRAVFWRVTVLGAAGATGLALWLPDLPTPVAFRLRAVRLPSSVFRRCRRRCSSPHW
jgi:predicted MFS family arabinose efflux permease